MCLFVPVCAWVGSSAVAGSAPIGGGQQTASHSRQARLIWSDLLSSLVERVVAVSFSASFCHSFFLWKSKTTEEAGRFDDESL